jgi:hypothetical protein
VSNKVESSADVGPDVVLGSNTAIWHLAQGVLPTRQDPQRNCVNFSVSHVRV